MTKLPDVIILNEPNLYYLSENMDNFITNIQYALIENDDNLIQSRIDYAMLNTWPKRILDIEKVINKLSPSISIVLLCWNHWNETRLCIESVINNSNYNNYELIVVNNGSTDNTANGLEYYKNTYKFITIVNNHKNYGFSKGMNIGSLHAKSDYIILLNNDTIVNKNWLYPLVKPLLLNKCNCCSPVTNNCGNEVKQFISYNNVNDLLLKAEKLQHNKLYKCEEIDRIPFFCPILKKNDFYSVGMLDEKYGIGGWEDDDIQEKFKLYKKDGVNYFTYGSFVYHMESLTMSDTSTNGKQWTQTNNNKTIFEEKWGRRWVPPKYRFYPLLINNQTEDMYVKNCLNDTELYNNTNTGIVIYDGDNNYTDGINVRRINEKIDISYKKFVFTLNVNEWNKINLYSIINTCINCCYTD